MCRHRHAGTRSVVEHIEVFTLLNGTSGGQESKLTRKEADLLVIIQRADRAEFTIQDLQRLTGWSYSSIYRTIKGYDSRGKNYTGLLEKCPALSFTDRTGTLKERKATRCAGGPKPSHGTVSSTSSGPAVVCAGSTASRTMVMEEVDLCSRFPAVFQQMLEINLKFLPVPISPKERK